MLIYFVIFFIIAAFCFFDIEDKRDKLLIFWSMCLALAVFAGLRSAEASTDYENYLQFFKDIKPGITFYDPDSFSEPFYNFIPAFIKLLGINVLFAFLVYSILGVFSKGMAIVNLTPLVFLSLLIYYSNFFILHEMTQIRVGVAVGIYLIGTRYILKRELVKFSLLMIFAICFHVSAIILWLTYFIGRTEFNKKKYIILILAVLPIPLLKLDVLSLSRSLPLGVFTDKIDIYYSAMETGIFSSDINVFNVVIILNIILCFTFIWKIELFQRHFRYSILFVKMYIIGLILFMFLSFMPPLAFRFRELFEIVQIILIPQLYFLFKEKFIGKIVVVSIAFLLFYMNVVHIAIVGPYFK